MLKSQKMAIKFNGVQNKLNLIDNDYSISSFICSFIDSSAVSVIHSNVNSSASNSIMAGDNASS